MCVCAFQVLLTAKYIGACKNLNVYVSVYIYIYIYIYISARVPPYPYVSSKSLH